MGAGQRHLSGGGLIPKVPDSKDVDYVLGALADPTRRRVLDELSARGPLTATELARQAPITRQAVVKHLSTLAAAGLVAGERHGREVRFAVRAEGLAGVSEWIQETGAAWDRRLAALSKHLSPDSPAAD